VKAAARADARAASAGAPGKTLLVARTGTRIVPGRARTHNNSMRARPHLRNVPRIPEFSHNAAKVTRIIDLARDSYYFRAG